MAHTEHCFCTFSLPFFPITFTLYWLRHLCSIYFSFKKVPRSVRFYGCTNSLVTNRTFFHQIQNSDPSSWHPISQHLTESALRSWLLLSWQYSCFTLKTSSPLFQPGIRYPLSVNYSYLVFWYVDLLVSAAYPTTWLLQDVHVEIMERHYENVPTRWYAWIGGTMFLASICVVTFYPLQVVKVLDMMLTCHFSADLIDFSSARFGLYCWHWEWYIFLVASDLFLAS